MASNIANSLPIFAEPARPTEPDISAATSEIISPYKFLEISKKSKFIKPKLNPYFFYEIAPYITASMDISDGLFFELEKLSKASSVGFEFFNEIDESIGSSGEEYEILFSFDEKNLEKINKIAKKHKVDLNIFAKAIKGKYRTACKNHHF